MFPVSHSLDVPENETRSWIPKHPSVALLVAADLEAALEQFATIAEDLKRS